MAMTSATATKAPADIERFPEQEQRNDLRRVVQTARETDNTGAEKMAGIHDSLRAEAEERTGITLATILLLIDRERNRGRRSAKGEQRRLRQSDDAFLRAETNAPFLGDAGRETKCAQQNSKSRRDRDRENWTEQKRQNKAFASAAKFTAGPDRDQSAADDRTGQRMRGRNRETGQRREDDRETRAECDGENENIPSRRIDQAQSLCR